MDQIYNSMLFMAQVPAERPAGKPAQSQESDSFQKQMEQASGKTYAAMLPFIESITTKTSGENTVYILRLNDAFGQMMNGILGQVLDTMPAGMDMRMGLEAGAITYTVDPNKVSKESIDPP